MKILDIKKTAKHATERMKKRESAQVPQYVKTLALFSLLTFALTK